MKPYLFGSRLGHLIFDLDVTAEHLQDALNFTAHIAHRGGIILFVSHNPKHTLTIEKTAAEAGEYAHAREWNSFLFTNSEKIYQGVTRLPDLLILLSTLNPLMQVKFLTKILLNCPKLTTFSLGAHCCQRCSQIMHPHSRYCRHQQQSKFDHIPSSWKWWFSNIHWTLLWII